MAPKVSVQVLNYNGRCFLKNCFDSILKQEYPNFEVVLVDNGSSDRSVEFVKNHYEKEIQEGKIKIFAFEKNYGFAEGYNKAYKKTDADYVLLLNNDTILPDRKLIKKLVRRAESDKKIAIVGSLCFSLNTNLKEVKNTMKDINIVGINVSTSFKKRSIYVGGYCCLIKKKYIKKLFDSDYFAYGEDVYLGWLTNLLGYKCVYEPEARLWHYGSATNVRGSPMIRYYSERNRLINLLIFYETTTLIKLFPILIIDFFVRGIFLLQRPNVFAAYLSAPLWIISNFRKIIKKRKKIQNQRIISDREILKLMSKKIFITTEIRETSYYATLAKFGVDKIIVKINSFFNTLFAFYFRIVGL